MKKYFVLLVVIFFTTTTYSQPATYKIITSDVTNFWRAYDSLPFTKDTLGVFQRQVINNASSAFRIFIQQRQISAGNYAKQVKAYPAFYATARSNSLRLIETENEIRELVQKFKNVYPRFKEADIVIAFGNFSTGGTIAISDKQNRVFIGLEYQVIDSSVNVSELSPQMKQYVDRSNFFKTVLHELVHIQQFTHGKKVKAAYSGNVLANQILREGIPDFVATFLYQKGNLGNHVEYGVMNEGELKQKLAKELWQKGFSYWIYNSNTITDVPKDLGYFMGARIAANYRQNDFTSTIRPIKKIIEVKNLKRFIKRSRYFK